MTSSPGAPLVCAYPKRAASAQTARFERTSKIGPRLNRSHGEMGALPHPEIPSQMAETKMPSVPAQTSADFQFEYIWGGHSLRSGKQVDQRRTAIKPVPLANPIIKMTFSYCVNLASDHSSKSICARACSTRHTQTQIYFLELFLPA